MYYIVHYNYRPTTCTVHSIPIGHPPTVAYLLKSDSIHLIWPDVIFALHWDTRTVLMMQMPILVVQS